MLDIFRHGGWRVVGDGGWKILNKDGTVAFNHHKQLIAGILKLTFKYYINGK